MSAEQYVAYSVLMSVYSKENPAWLKLAIESMQTQTLPTSDFVLVCDGPLTPELDGVIAEKRRQMGETLTVVRLEKNMGLGNALNEGIRHCRNDLVARMQYFFAGFFQKRMKAQQGEIGDECSFRQKNKCR